MSLAVGAVVDLINLLLTQHQGPCLRVPQQLRRRSHVVGDFANRTSLVYNLDQGRSLRAQLQHPSAEMAGFAEHNFLESLLIPFGLIGSLSEALLSLINTMKDLTI